eukprot:1895391-Pyramimonas_sp.AAC.1
MWSNDGRWRQAWATNAWRSPGLAAATSSGGPVPCLSTWNRHRVDIHASQSTTSTSSIRPP